MNGIQRRTVLAALGAAIAAPAFGHSTRELTDLLGDREQFFQAFDRDVPDFTLSDADGKLHTLADFRGKVVVLHFVYARCPDRNWMALRLPDYLFRAAGWNDMCGHIDQHGDAAKAMAPNRKSRGR